MSLSEDDKRWFEQVIDERLETKLRSMEHVLDERLERLETKLLTAFHSWAQSMEARQKSHAAAIKALDAEMEYLSDRVKKLEPPSPQI